MSFRYNAKSPLFALVISNHLSQSKFAADDTYLKCNVRSTIFGNFLSVRLCISFSDLFVDADWMSPREAQ